jgi:hypothetical protein
LFDGLLAMRLQAPRWAVASDTWRPRGRLHLAQPERADRVLHRGGLAGELGRRGRRLLGSGGVLLRDVTSNGAGWLASGVSRGAHGFSIQRVGWALGVSGCLSSANTWCSGSCAPEPTAAGTTTSLLAKR